MKRIRSNFVIVRATGAIPNGATCEVDLENGIVHMVKAGPSANGAYIRLLAKQLADEIQAQENPKRR